MCVEMTDNERMKVKHYRSEYVIRATRDGRSVRIRKYWYTVVRYPRKGKRAYVRLKFAGYSRADLSTVLYDRNIHGNR